MTIDMTNNRVPYGLLTDEEKAALHEHEKAGGKFQARYSGTMFVDPVEPTWHHNIIYRTVPLPKTQDVIAWDRLPDWVEWVARDEIDGAIHAYDANEPWLTAEGGVWLTSWDYRRIDDFPGIVQIGTVDWKDSKQRKPRG
jgi:hypothetical protein